MSLFMTSSTNSFDTVDILWLLEMSLKMANKRPYPGVKEPRSQCVPLTTMLDTGRQKYKDTRINTYERTLLNNAFLVKWILRGNLTFKYIFKMTSGNKGQVHNY